MLRSIFSFAALALLASAPAHAETHPFTVRDLVMLKRLSEPTVSPDGKRIAFILRTTDLEANKGSTDLWMINADGTGLKQLTSTAARESNPRFSPDGKTLYYLESGEKGLLRSLSLSAEGASPAPATLPFEGDATAFLVSPDGKTLLVAAPTFPDCPDLACAAQRLADRAKEKSSGQLYTQLFVRHWDTWGEGRRSHLFALPLAGGPGVDLMKGMDADCPSKPFGGIDEFAFTPDGRGVVFTARDVGKEEAWSTNLDLFQAPLDGSTSPLRLTTSNKATDTSPLFSPDGQSLVYRAMKAPGHESDRYRILLRAGTTGADREVAPRWDRSPQELLFSADGRTLYAIADNLGHTSTFAIDVATGAAREVVKDGTFTGLGLAGNRLIALRDDLTHPAQLVSFDPSGGTFQVLFDPNGNALQELRMGPAEQFSFKGAGGKTVYAWLIKPIDLAPGQKVPVALLIHGGPQNSMGNHFHYRWNPQTYAGHGYAAVMIDFTGSTGYGQAFTDAISGDWGGKPFIDIQKGLKAATDKYPFLDAGKVCALGGSYGGYMVNWLAGKMPDRFKCLVSHSGYLDEYMGYFETEELWFAEHEHGGTPWEKPEAYRKFSPIHYVKNWKTPMLVIQGGKDYRVVETQSLGTFNALQRRGIPSEFLYFPDENHWILKPANSIRWHETVLAWLDRWTK